jgi:hypothetical protein
MGAGDRSMRIIVPAHRFTDRECSQVLAIENEHRAVRVMECGITSRSDQWVHVVRVTAAHHDQLRRARVLNQILDEVAVHGYRLHLEVWIASGPRPPVWGSMPRRSARLRHARHLRAAALTTALHSVHELHSASEVFDTLRPRRAITCDD